MLYFCVYRCKDCLFTTYAVSKTELISGVYDAKSRNNIKKLLNHMADNGHDYRSNVVVA